MSKLDFNNSVWKKIEDLPDDEFKAVLSAPQYFFLKFSEIKVDYEERANYYLSHPKLWGAFIRELFFFNDVGVKEMNERILFLSLRYLPKGEEFYKIRYEKGAFTIPSRIQKLNKIKLLAKDLIYDIFPKIEDHLNFKAELKSETSKMISGKIDWNATLLNSIRQGDKFPLQFTCLKYDDNFETSENKLAVLCLLKLKNDINFVLHTKKDNEELNFNELQILKNLLHQIDVLLSHTKLKTIVSQIKDFSILSVNSKIFRDLENETSEQIRYGNIKQSSYKELLEWIQKYRGYNFRDLSAKYTNFPIEHEKPFDKLYELWIFFEMSNFFIEQKGFIPLGIIKNSRKEFMGFRFKVNGLILRFNFQDYRTGWASDSEPDFTIQREGSDDIPIILDPKNYSTQGVSEPVHKILGYMLNLDEFNPQVGIIFFPRYLGKLDEKIGPYFVDSKEIRGKIYYFISMVATATKPHHLPTNFELIYSHIQNLILEK